MGDSNRIGQLVRHFLIYGLGTVASKVAAILLLPLYTAYLNPTEYGLVELIITLVAATSIFAQLGLTNAFFRFFYDDRDEQGQRRLFRTISWAFITTSTLLATIMALAAEPIGDFVLGSGTDNAADLVRIGAFGLWVTVNYELTSALFRAQKRPIAFSIASFSNLVITVGCTLFLVIGLGWEAEGLLLGNFLGSAAVYLVVVAMQRSWFGFGRERGLLPQLLAFSLPMLPSAIAVWGVNLVNRPIVAAIEGTAALGIFAVGFKIAQGILLLVRAFQLAWPPIAHSIKDDDEARRTYAVVFSLYLAAIAIPVLIFGLAAPWIVRLLTTPEFDDARLVVFPLVAAVALYGSYFVANIPIMRVKKTQFNWVITGAAVAIEVALLYLLTPLYGIEGAAWATFGAFASMLVFMIAHSQRYFHVPYQWGRVARVVVLVSVAAAVGGQLPEHGLGALAGRMGIVALYLPALALTGFFNRDELGGLKALARRPRRPRPSTSAAIPDDDVSPGVSDDNQNNI